MISLDLNEEEVAAGAVEEEDTEEVVDLEEEADSVEGDVAEEADQAVAASQEFVPFSCPKSRYMC